MIAFLLALCLVVPHSPTTSPTFLAAGTGYTVSYQGYHAQIQMRPYSTQTNTFAWVGGYLSDGTFIQSGIYQPGPNNPSPQAFLWVDVPGRTVTYLPLSFSDLSWVDFYAQKSGSTWSFWLVGPDGVRVNQGTATDASSMDAYQAVAESYDTVVPTQAMRRVQALSGSTWLTPHLIFAPPTPPCGFAEIKATPGLNLVFRSTSGGSPCYVVLSP